MKSTAVIAIDQGTTSTRVIAFEVTDFQVICTEQLEFTQYFPKAGYVEHDLEEIWMKTKSCLEKVCQQLAEKNFAIAAIGITNQRETVGFWDRRDGRPLARAMVWQDRRTAEFCSQHKTEFAKKWGKKCGLPLDPYFSATKISWALEHVSEVKSYASQHPERLCIGTVDSFLLFKLTQHQVFATDASNASRTLLMELEGKSWSEGLCQFFNIDQRWLGEIKDSLGEFGKTGSVSKLIPNHIPITAIIGDQQAALFAQGCISLGEMKCTYGTGAFLLAHTGERPQHSEHGLLTTVALQYHQQRFFALEGACFIAGAAVQWLRDGLKMIEKSFEIETLACEIGADKNSHMMELYFLPFFTGIGAPRWVSDAKGTIWGLERGTTRQHIAKACLEGIALSIDDLVNALELDLGHKILEMRVDGGATSNQLLMRMQSLISKRAVILPKNSESTALGAAAGAWIAVNHWPLSKIKDFSKVAKKVEFDESDSEASYFQTKRTGWKTLLDRLY